MISGHMQISDILSPAAVRTMSQITSKKRLFQEIAEQARSIYGVDAAQTLDAPSTPEFYVQAPQEPDQSGLLQRSWRRPSVASSRFRIEPASAPG